MLNMSIYTRTGDKGTTALFGGKRVPKHDDLVSAYGTVDELNSWVGLVAAEMQDDRLVEFLHKIQADLFTIGGNLAGWKSDLSILPARVTEMEVEIDVMEADVTKLTNFVLPGGSPLAAKAHIARSICRRVERLVVGLSQKNPVEESIIQYFNRLSDLFFMLARFINKKSNVEDVVWSGIPRSDRKNK